MERGEATATDRRREVDRGDLGIERGRVLAGLEDVLEPVALDVVDERPEARGVAGHRRAVVGLGVELRRVDVERDVRHLAVRDLEVPGQLERPAVVGEDIPRRARRAAP